MITAKWGLGPPYRRLFFVTTPSWDLGPMNRRLWHRNPSKSELGAQVSLSARSRRPPHESARSGCPPGRSQDSRQRGRCLGERWRPRPRAGLTGSTGARSPKLAPVAPSLPSGSELGAPLPERNSEWPSLRPSGRSRPTSRSACSGERRPTSGPQSGLEPSDGRQERPSAAAVS